MTFVIDLVHCFSIECRSSKLSLLGILPSGELFLRCEVCGSLMTFKVRTFDSDEGEDNIVTKRREPLGIG